MPPSGKTQRYYILGTFGEYPSLHSMRETNWNELRFVKYHITAVDFDQVIIIQFPRTRASVFRPATSTSAVVSPTAFSCIITRSSRARQGGHAVGGMTNIPLSPGVAVRHWPRRFRLTHDTLGKLCRFRLSLSPRRLSLALVAREAVL